MGYTALMQYPFRKHSKKGHWLRWLFTLCIPVMLFFVVFGNGGLGEMYTLHMELEFIQERIDDLERGNAQQRSIINRVRNNPDVARHMASKKALVAPEGSVIYRFHPQKNDEKIPSDDERMEYATDRVSD